MPVRPPARLPNARRRRPDTRRSQFERSPENQKALIVAVRLVNPDSWEIQFDRPVTCYNLNAGGFHDDTVDMVATDWAQTSPLTYQVQMEGSGDVGDLWTYDSSAIGDFSPEIANLQHGVVIAN